MAADTPTCLEKIQAMIDIIAKNFEGHFAYSEEIEDRMGAKLMPYIAIIKELLEKELPHCQLNELKFAITSGEEVRILSAVLNRNL